MSGLDALPQIAIGLVIVGVVSFIGLGIADAAARSSGVDVPTEMTKTVNDAFGWLPMMILAIMGGVAITAIFGYATMSGYSSPSERTRKPEPFRPRKPEPERLYWDPYERRVSPVVVPPVRAAPAPVAPAPTVTPPEPTVDEIVARDPEIVMLNRDVRSLDTEIDQLREQREQSLASRTWFERLVLRFKKPTTAQD